MPTLNMDEYRFRAVIDCIEFRVQLARPTPAQHVQTVLRCYLARDSFINPEDKCDGNVFAACTIKVQEPPSFALIYAILYALYDTFGEFTSARSTMKAPRTMSPFQQVNSKPSEHQRRFERMTMTLPS